MRGNKKGLYFYIGIILLCIGIMTVFQTVSVSTSWGGFNFIGIGLPTGAILIPMLIGVIMLFYKRSVLSWLVFIAGVLFILITVLMSVRLHVRQTSLFTFILMFGSIFAGLGLTLRDLFKKDK